MAYLSVIKLAAVGIGLALLAALFIHVTGRMDLANDLVAATRNATGNAKLDDDKAVDAIEALGKDHDELVRLQSITLAESERTTTLRKEGVKASNSAAERVEPYRRSASALEAAAARPRPAEADCLTSEEVKGLWK